MWSQWKWERAMKVVPSWRWPEAIRSLPEVADAAAGVEDRDPAVVGGEQDAGGVPAELLELAFTDRGGPPRAVELDFHECSPPRRPPARDEAPARAFTSERGLQIGDGSPNLGRAVKARVDASITRASDPCNRFTILGWGPGPTPRRYRSRPTMADPGRYLAHITLDFGNGGR